MESGGLSRGARASPWRGPLASLATPALRADRREARRVGRAALRAATTSGRSQGAEGPLVLVLASGEPEGARAA